MKTMSGRVTAAGQIHNGPATVFTVMVKAGAGGAAAVEVRDGGASGTIKADVGTAGASQCGPPLMLKGLSFSQDVYITGTNIGAVSVEYLPG